MAEPEESGGRKLNAFDATMLVMGGIIGVGIFFAPRGVAQHVPDGTVFLGMWLAGGLIAMCGAFTFAEWASSMPKAGGWFVFLREALSPFVAFVFAWVILGVVSTGAIAVIASFGAQNIGVFTSWIGPPDSLSHHVLAAAIILVLTAVTLCGVKVGATVQNVCMITKLIALVALVAGGVAFLLGGGVPGEFPAADRSKSLVSGVPAAALSVFFAYGGWQHICYIAPQVRDPARVLPRAIVIGVLGVAAVYLAANFAYLQVLGIDGIVASENVGAALARDSLGARFEKAVSAAMGVSALGVCAVNVIVTPGIYVAMARDGLFFRSFGRLSARTQAPVLALALQCVLSLGYLLWSFVGTRMGPAEPGEFRMTVSLLTDSVVFAEWIFHGCVAYGLLHIRRTRPDLPRPFRMPLWPIPALVYLVVAILIVWGNLRTWSNQTLVGLVVVSLGAAIYLPWRRLFKPGE